MGQSFAAHYADDVPNKNPFILQDARAEHPLDGTTRPTKNLRAYRAGSQASLSFHSRSLQGSQLSPRQDSELSRDPSNSLLQLQGGPQTFREMKRQIPQAPPQQQPRQGKQQHVDRLQPILSDVGTSSSEGKTKAGGVSMLSGTSTKSRSTKSSSAKSKSRSNSRRKKRRSKSRSKSRDGSENKSRRDPSFRGQDPSFRENTLRPPSIGSSRQRKLPARNSINRRSSGGIPAGPPTLSCSGDDERSYGSRGSSPETSVPLTNEEGMEEVMETQEMRMGRVGPGPRLRSQHSTRSSDASNDPGRPMITIHNAHFDAMSA